MAPRRPRISQSAQIMAGEGDSHVQQPGGKVVMTTTRRKRHVSAVEPAAFMNEQKECVYCHAIDNCTFRYINNCSESQPRYECLSCGECFTHGFHGRVAGRKYKKRGEEPEELQGVRKVCSNPECGAENNATFLYYNNKSSKGTSQPRYACNSCKTEFQLFPAKRRRKTCTSATGKPNSKSKKEEASMSGGWDAKFAQSVVQPVAMSPESLDSSRYGTQDLHMSNSVLQDELRVSTSGRDFDVPSHIDVPISAQADNWAEEDFSDYPLQDLDMKIDVASSSDASMMIIGSPFMSAPLPDEHLAEDNDSATGKSNSKSRKAEASMSGGWDAKFAQGVVKPVAMSPENLDSSRYATLDLHMSNSVLQGELTVSTSGGNFDVPSHIDVPISAKADNWAQEDFSHYSLKDLDKKFVASSRMMNTASPFLSASLTDEDKQWVEDDASSAGLILMHMNSEEDAVALPTCTISDDDAFNGGFVSGSMAEPSGARMADQEESSNGGLGMDLNEYENIALSATDELVSCYLNPEPAMVILSSPEEQQQACTQCAESELQMEEEDSLKDLLEQAMDIARQSSWDFSGLFGEDAACHDSVDDCWDVQLPLGTLFS